jgi:fucose 4-O-acetylase-like acetyltransferase
VVDRTTAAKPGLVEPEGTHGRWRYVDNLKVALVVGVIVAHTSIAWTGVAEWVLYEPELCEPWFSVVALLVLAGGLFGMALFFTLAGMFTAPSLRRKGLGKFLVDRVIRLGIPLLVYAIVLSPFVEYVDTDNAGFDRGFWAFTWEIWWPPTPGPTWFLWVLLLFSVVYALARTVWPSRTDRPGLGLHHLLIGALVAAVGSYVLRLTVPLGEEVWGISLAQMPPWVVGFTFGAVAGERGWFEPIPRLLAVLARRTAWVALGVAMIAVAITTTIAGDMEPFLGAGTWQSLLMATLEGVLVMTMPVWLLDLFRGRFDHQSPLAHEMARAAFATFVVHQVVLVGLVLASRYVPWLHEAEYVLVTAIGVAASFFVGWLLLRLPGVSRVL